MPHIYCIPGMGTDRRVFQFLSEQMPEIQWHYWEFIEPLSAKEPMESYIERCMQAWEQPQEPPIILAMSLGGILATEWCKRNDYKKLFLLSTLHRSSEAPIYFRWLRRIPLHRAVPSWLARLSWGRWGKFLGITDAKGQVLLRDMIVDASPLHLRWGRNTAVHWQNDQPLERAVRIHGTKDHVFPYKKVKPYCDYTIENGTHCAVMNNAAQIADILRKEL